jgi:hypothetical protein
MSGKFGVWLMFRRFLRLFEGEKNSEKIKGMSVVEKINKQ